MADNRRVVNSATRAELICEECRETFYVWNHQKNSRRFCSRTCGSRNYHRKVKLARVVTKKCLHCSEDFTRNVHNNKPDPKYCCTDCANKHRIILKNNKLKIA